MRFSSLASAGFALLAGVQLAAAVPRTRGRDFNLSEVIDELEHDVETFIRDVSQAVSGNGDCQNGPKSRSCWGKYNVDTNSYTTWPNTGKTRDFYFNVVNKTLSPDGYMRSTLSFNGQIPGPAIVADWGDIIRVHVTNQLASNGTAVHFHGLRQLNTNEMDGVPGVTQCPIAPGQSYTYTFQATEYGSSWYHSHDTLQYSDGLMGPIVINGPATADYDVDTGVMMVADWPHKSAFTEWWQGGRTFGTPAGGVANALINGRNTYSPCANSTDANCVGTGSRWNTTFTPGTKYLFRVVNAATNGFVRFSVDNHTLNVIANDFVPIQPFQTDSIVLAIGQRYDIVVEANQLPGNYWLRATWQQSCAANSAPDGVKGIVSYGGVPAATPNTTAAAVADSCDDPPASSLVPRVKIPVGGSAISGHLDLSYNATPIFNGGYFRWYINGSDMVTNWTAPTVAYMAANQSIPGSHANAYTIPESSGWSVWLIQDHTNTAVHPMHIHGHDFWVMAQLPGQYAPGDEAKWNLQNPPRRDTVGLPKGGYLALAVQVDNPGAWLFHCHVPWHVSSGLAVQFIEREGDFKQTLKDPRQIADTCKSWYKYSNSPANVYPQEDSGL